MSSLSSFSKEIRAKLKVSLLISSPFLLSGCDIFNSKEPLPGKRETLFATESIIKTDVSGSAAVSVPKGELNKEWSIPGGKLSNALPPLALNDSLSSAWSTSIGSGVSSSKRFTSNVIVHRDVAYAMDTNGVVNAVDMKDGQLLWSVHVGACSQESENLGGGVAASGDTLFVTTSFGHVLALDARTGKELWDKDLVNPIRVAPTISAGNVYVVNIANETHALDIKTGDEKWSHAGLPEATGILGGAVPAIENGLIYVPYSSGEIFALDLQTGQTKWVEVLVPKASFDSLSSISHIRARPIVYDNTVYAISHGGRMVALDAQTGSIKWQREFAGIRTPSVYGQYLYFVTIDGELTCLDRHNGHVVWSHQLPVKTSDKTKISWAGPVIAGGNLLLTGSNGQVIRHSLSDGKCVSAFDAGDTLSLSPVVVDGSLILLTDSARLSLWR